MVRLFHRDGTLIGTTTLRTPHLRQRTISRGGFIYELVSDLRGNLDYRALDFIPTVEVPTVDIINTAGSRIGQLPRPEVLPAVVEFAGVSCPLWTVKDQAGRALYLKPEPVDGAG